MDRIHRCSDQRSYGVDKDILFSKDIDAGL